MRIFIFVVIMALVCHNPLAWAQSAASTASALPAAADLRSCPFIGVDDDAAKITSYLPSGNPAPLEWAATKNAYDTAVKSSRILCTGKQLLNGKVKAMQYDYVLPGEDRLMALSLLAVYADNAPVIVQQIDNVYAPAEQHFAGIRDFTFTDKNCPDCYGFFLTWQANNQNTENYYFFDGKSWQDNIEKNLFSQLSAFANPAQSNTVLNNVKFNFASNTVTASFNNKSDTAVVNGKVVQDTTGKTYAITGNLGFDTKTRQIMATNLKTQKQQ